LTIKTLTAKQLNFCHEYLIDSNATQAALRAGYSEKTAFQIGYENLTKLEIQEYLQKKRSKIAEKLEISTEKVLLEMARIAFYRVPDLFKDDGSIKDIKDIDENISAAIHGIKMGHVIIKNPSGEDEVKTYIKSVKFQPKDRALENLAKHLGLFEKDNKQKGEADQAAREQFMADLFGAISVANGRGLPEPRQKMVENVGGLGK